MYPKSKLGFTLIELLVVIAIIGILSSVVLASLNSARVSARDAARIATIQELQQAIEIHFQRNGKYPDTYDAAGNSAGGSSGSLRRTFENNDMGGIIDPSNIDWDFLYPDIAADTPGTYITNSHTGPAGNRRYGIRAQLEQVRSYTDSNAYCRTGNIPSGSGWWDPMPFCEF